MLHVTCTILHLVPFSHCRNAVNIVSTEITVRKNRYMYMLQYHWVWADNISPPYINYIFNPSPALDPPGVKQARMNSKFGT